MLARSLGSDKEFQPNIDGACLMRLSGIDEVSKVVSVIEVEGGKERKRGKERNRETPLMKPSQLRSRAVGISLN